MIFVPLPFVIAILLAILLVRMFRQGDWNTPEKRPFLLLITVYTLQSVLIGIRWGYDVIDIVPAQAIVAALIASLAWISFEALRWKDRSRLFASGRICCLRADRLPPGVLARTGRSGPDRHLSAYGAAPLALRVTALTRFVSSRLDGALLSTAPC